MRAMVLETLGSLRDRPAPLVLKDVPVPQAENGQVLIRVAACGVCHTELDEIEGRTPPPRLPVIPGHQVVGTVVACGPGVTTLAPGCRVGVAWIFSSCGQCSFCSQGLENLCDRFQATGRDADGGYAEMMVASADAAFPLPEAIGDVEAAPLLCAGAIGYRSLALARLADGQALGLTGFGASGHLVLKMARHLYPATQVFVFARAEQERAFALELGAAWAGATQDRPPRPLDAIIDTTPAWQPVVEALASLAPGGRLVINAIRKEEGDKDALLNLDYPAHLWMEKEIKSVANIARADVRDFLALAATRNLAPEVTTYPLDHANQALAELASGHIRGAKVLVL